MFANLTRNLTPKCASLRIHSIAIAGKKRYSVNKTLATATYQRAHPILHCERAFSTQQQQKRVPIGGVLIVYARNSVSLFPYSLLRGQDWH